MQAVNRALFICFLLLIACSKNTETDDYTSYYPHLMNIDVLRDYPHVGFARVGQNETQMEVVGPVLFVLDESNGVSALQASTNKRVLFCISPGASYMVPYFEGVMVDRTVDLVTFGKKSNQTVTYVGASLDVLEELQAPDGKKIPPIFQRENRIKNTEIIRWLK
ncbi:MAG TPA: hypothetical protein DIW47_06565 [Bacteroidetes bacterium]|nr:hypothetical protein [Bacteroidota bacterium]